MKTKVLNTEGKATGREVDLDKEIFAIEPNDHLLYLSAKLHMANRRQGTHKTKERGEIQGSRRKLKRQKGTGTARAGDIKNPLFRGGGRIFGPRPRDYGFKMNRKERALARKSALSYKAKDKQLMVVEDFAMEAPKTKRYVEILANLGLSGERSLLVTSDSDMNVIRSAKNLPRATVKSVSELHTYDIMHCDKLVLSESSVAAIKEQLNKAK